MLAFPQERMDGSWEKAGPSNYELQQVYHFTFNYKSFNQFYLKLSFKCVYVTVFLKLTERTKDIPIPF